MKKLLSILIGVNIVLGLQAQVRGNNIVVTVTPDHKDWTYRKGEKISFEVKVLQSSTLLDNVQIDYEMGPELYPDVKKSELLKQGKIIISGKMNKPGFYRLRVKAHVNGKGYEGVCTAAVDPEEIQPQAQCPEDFDTFWSKALEQARWTALEPIMEPLPARSTDKVNTYHVSFQNDKWGRRVYAILNVPKAPGKYPAVLKVPGAGVRPYNGDQWTAAKGCIVLEIGIHGVPVTNPQSYYDEFDATKAAPLAMPVTSTVEGFMTAVQYMVKGDDWMVYIPQELAYKENASQAIPAYSTLLYHMRIEKVHKSGTGLSEWR